MRHIIVLQIRMEVMEDELVFNHEPANTLELEDGGDEDQIELVHRTPQTPRPQSQARAPTQHSAPAPRPRVPAFQDKTFEMFSNPTKRAPSEGEPDAFGEESPAQSVQSELSEPHMPMFGGEDDFEADEEPRPSNGFSSIDDEKQDILYKFHRLESKGVKLFKRFNMQSDVREMRMEFNKIKRDIDVKNSLKFSKQVLMTIVSGTELLNKRYNPVGVELNGWSETVMENMNDGDYDSPLERLHDKYAGKINAPPEMELLMSLAGSAVMFHMTSVMFKSVPDIGNLAKQNPEVKSAMKSVADSILKSQMSPPPREPPMPQSVHTNDGRREMKGPSINLGQFGNMLPTPVMTRSQPEEQAAPIQEENNVTFQDNQSDTSSNSSRSGMSVKQVSVAVSEGGTRRGRKPKITATRENTIDL